MSSKLFIGSLAWATTDESLRQKFEEFGQVEDAVVIRDRETGRSRGFGFVTFATEGSAEQAIQAMNDAELDGRNIRVDRASANGGGSGSRGGDFGRNGRGRGGGRYGGGSWGSRNDDSYGSGDRW